MGTTAQCPLVRLTAVAMELATTSLDFASAIPIGDSPTALLISLFDFDNQIFKKLN